MFVWCIKESLLLLWVINCKRVMGTEEVHSVESDWIGSLILASMGCTLQEKQLGRQVYGNQHPPLETSLKHRWTHLTKMCTIKCIQIIWKKENQCFSSTGSWHRGDQKTQHGGAWQHSTLSVQAAIAQRNLSKEEEATRQPFRVPVTVDQIPQRCKNLRGSVLSAHRDADSSTVPDY